MVNQTVTLPDGSTQVVSVPKLYARVHPDDLQGNGTLLAGNTVRINTADKVINSGSVNGRELTDIAAGSLLNTGDISGSIPAALCLHPVPFSLNELAAVPWKMTLISPGLPDCREMP